MGTKLRKNGSFEGTKKRKREIDRRRRRKMITLVNGLKSNQQIRKNTIKSKR